MLNATALSMSQLEFVNIIFAKEFDYPRARRHAWAIIWPAFCYSMAYIVTIFSIKAVMTRRQPFQLTWLLNAWNAWLAVFSLAGSIVHSYGLVVSYREKGFVDTYCTEGGPLFEGVSGLFMYLFMLSKMLEFGDTILIVLRKKPLIFLHWYHHVLTMNYAIWSYASGFPGNAWIAWLNFTVHAIMYGYYMLRSMNVKIPAAVAQLITSSQIMQFVLTHALLLHIGYDKYLGAGRCQFDDGVYWLCLGMEISYLILFGNFFYQSYVKGGGKKYNKEKKETKKAE